jgi:hypothetical protein
MNPAGAPELYYALSSLNMNDLPRTCLPWREVVAALAASPARRLLLADLWHAGNTLGESLASCDLVAASARRTGTILLTAISGEELGRDLPTEKRGAFAAAVLDALAGKGAPEQAALVTVLDFITSVQERVRQATNGAQRPWQPGIENLNPRLPLVRRR